LIRDPGRSEGTNMSIDTALEQYFAAWNSHQPEAVPAALTDGGTYEDPTTGGRLSGDALTANVAGVLEGFPDVHFEIVSVATNADGTASAQWRMIGTNTGPLPGGPATGMPLDLPGADFFTYDADVDKVSSVVGYFDTATMLGQLGLQAHITPADMEPVTKFGYALRVDAGRDRPPGAFTVTWIEIDHEYDAKLTDATIDIVMEQLGNEDGYFGSCFAVVGRRHYTFTAWASPEAAQEALRGDAHTNAMKLAQSGDLGINARGVTSVWQPLHLNGVFNPNGASLDLSELGGQWL
jgi:steroid delta-isomerase-like uncharacterized protein